MSNIKLLILFNIIIIFLSFQFKNNIIIVYPFIFILLISMFIKLMYKKNIEGNFYDKDSEIFSFWDRLNDETPLEEENSSNNIILNKINQFISLIMEVEKKGEEEYEKIKCEGRFVKKASKKKCGYNAYNEKVYEITKPGINCNHRDGYSERDFLPRCRLDEKCDSDRDCEKGKCHRGKCQIEFGCSPHKLDNCDEAGCDKLNEHVGIDKYAFKDGKCKSNSCNADQFYNCDEEGCINLDYKFMWDEEDKECKNREYDVNTCSQYSCPKGYSNFNDEYQCKRKLSRGELQSKLEQNCDENGNSEGCKDFELNEEDEGFISECNRNVCCMKNYTCDRYFAPTGKDISDCNCGEDGNCGDNCYEGETLDSYKYYVNGEEKTQYYNYKDNIDKDGKIFKGENICNGLNCTKEECTQQCSDFDGKEEECDGTGCNYCLGNCFSESETPVGCPYENCSGVDNASDVCDKFIDCDYCPITDNCVDEGTDCPDIPDIPCSEIEGKDKCNNNIDCDYCPITDNCVDDGADCPIQWCDSINPSCTSCYVENCSFGFNREDCTQHYELLQGDIGIYCQDRVPPSVYPSCSSDPLRRDRCRIRSNVGPPNK